MHWMYERLKEHIGHNVVCVAYGDINDPVDICIECEDCNEAKDDLEFIGFTDEELCALGYKDIFFEEEE